MAKNAGKFSGDMRPEYDFTKSGPNAYLRKAQRTKYFTVIGFFNDEKQVWCEQVRAKTWREAATAAVERIRRINDNLQGGISVVSVIKGSHWDLSDWDDVQEYWEDDEPKVAIGKRG